MRKDMRFAWAAGGLLVIVMAVYLVVVATSSHNKNSQPVQLVTEAPTGQPAAPAASTPAATPEPAQAVAQASTPAVESATAAPNAAPQPSKGDVWGALLTTGQAPAGMLMTQTPRAAEQTASTASSTSADVSQVSDAADIPQAASADPAGASAAASTAGNTSVASEVASNTPAAASPPTANTARPASGAIKHVVQAGETFSTISAKAYGSTAYWSHIARANPHVDPRHLKVGQVLIVPDPAEVTSAAHTAVPAVSGKIDPAKQYAVVAGDNLYKISVKLYGSGKYTQALYDLNKQVIGPNPAHLKLNMVLQLPQPPVKH